MNFSKIKNLPVFLALKIDKIIFFTVLASFLLPYKSFSFFISSLLYGTLILMLGELLRFWSLMHSIKLSKNKLKLLEDFSANGPYSYVRNPLYLSNIIIISSLVIINGARFFSIFIAIIFFFIYNEIAKLEEENLLRIKGRDYFRYKTCVSRWFPSFYIKLSQDSKLLYFWEVLDFEKSFFIKYLAVIGLAFVKQLIINQLF